MQPGVCCAVAATACQGARKRLTPRVREK